MMPASVSMASILRTRALRLARSTEACESESATTAMSDAGRIETAVATAYVAIESGTSVKPVEATTMSAMMSEAPRSV